MINLAKSTFHRRINNVCVKFCIIVYYRSINTATNDLQCLYSKDAQLIHSNVCHLKHDQSVVMVSS